MLTDLNGVDRFVQLFYDELDKVIYIPTIYAGSLVHGIPVELAGLLSERERIDPEYAKEHRRKLEQETQKLVDTGAKEYARSKGLDALGVARVYKRAPVVFYTVEECEGSYEIGLDSQTLESFKWHHGTGLGARLCDLQRNMYRENQEGFTIYEHLCDLLGMRIFNIIFSGLMYQGKDEEGEDRLVVLCDTTDGTKNIIDDHIRKEKSIEAAKRYGVDIFLGLSAVELEGRDYFMRNFATQNTRLDIDDIRYGIDMVVTNFMEDARQHVLQRHELTS